MNPTLLADAQTVLDRLSALEAAPSATPQIREAAGLWKKLIGETRDFLASAAHEVVFIGNVGVGKSSLIGVLANLLVGPVADRPSLKDNSVLATGAGRTTICEVHIRARRDGDGGSVGLLIDPLSPEEMQKEIELYAESEWMRRHPDPRRVIEDDADPAQEIQRAIREMTDYAESPKLVFEEGRKRRRIVRPLDEAIPGFSDLDAFKSTLLERAKLDARTKTRWWWDTYTTENLKELKRVFEAVNQGRESAAMLPRRMTVVVPEPLPGSTAALDLTLIDTRGLDGKVESRRDLRDFLRDPRIVPVLCSSFEDAPGATMHELLRSMDGDPELRQAIPHLLLVVLDHGDADQVNGANGDRTLGQELKLDECHVALEKAGLQQVGKTQLIAFDVLKDDRARLLAAIDERLTGLRRSRMEALRRHVDDASSFLAGTNDEEKQKSRELVDRKLREMMARHPLTDAPLRDPLQGMYHAIDDCRYASVVYAACRRGGRYWRFDLFAAVVAEAARAAAEWLDTLVKAIAMTLDELGALPELQDVRDHVHLRRSQLEDGQRQVIHDYATQVSEQVAGLLPASVWEDCCREWGRGGGFKSRVIEHLNDWSRGEPRLTAHERTKVEEKIPLLKEVTWPVQASRFTLHVRALRVLREVTWTPEPVSVLIGANGAGKTTLLLTLRLLRETYERGLSEAVRIVLGGSSNLRSWGAPEDEPVEIGLALDEARWRITLIPREGSADYQTDERFMAGTHELFSRDTLGTFLYRGERLANPGWSTTGLRALMNQGKPEPELRKMASFLQSIAVYQDPDLWTLRTQGSSTTEDRQLHSRGTNALTMLRRWYQERDHRHRHQFVIEGLRAAFPNTVSDLDFVEAGTTLVARIYRPRMELPSPLANEANGVRQLLVLLCDVAAAEDGSVVAIDEPENSLHPYALRRFLSRTSRWAKQHNLTVLLATHSTVLLDELTAHPEQVYVMKPVEGKPTPTRLDELCDPEWLAHFKLGDLYEQGEIGSNEDELRPWP